MSEIDTTDCENGSQAPQRSTGKHAAATREFLEKIFRINVQSGNSDPRTREKREKTRISAHWRHCLSEASPSAKER